MVQCDSVEQAALWADQDCALYTLSPSPPLLVGCDEDSGVVSADEAAHINSASLIRDTALNIPRIVMSVNHLACIVRFTDLGAIL